MKTCLIYGQNGLDLDVTFNLVVFYKKLGYKTFFAEKLYDANLLVVLRAVETPIDLTNFHFGQIHVFDYGGWSYDGFVKSVDYSKTYIFTTSEATKKRLNEQLDFPKSHTFIAFPPVITSMWIAKSRKKKYNIVHVGNFKNIDDGDVIRESFLNCISKMNVDVWGLLWSISNNKYHGKAGLFEVAEIYSKSKYAFGLMYPFQREVTFSGRFWHAPLNGCYLFSEAGLYTSKIPGIIETDYTIDDITKKIQTEPNSALLQKEAISFWEIQNEKTNDIIKTLMRQADTKTVIFNIFHLKIILINTFRFIYQKFKLFKLHL